MMKLISKFALLITILAILYFLISGNLFSSSPFVIAGQLLAVALSFWARRSFQAGQFRFNAEPAEGTLLLAGPYQVIRHPMYTSAMLLVWSSILGHLSIINIVIGLIVAAIIAVRIVTEEQFLQAHYPDYAEYSRKTKRIIPYII
ncbi:MAG: isoprenylcysteine carboxylmethyltransferase family protein [Chloroflexi bacterium]|nr:isoprenylcysteine carboxylmethyltransferase family protein [Chloroflexota bacterium]